MGATAMEFRVLTSQSPNGATRVDLSGFPVTQACNCDPGCSDRTVAGTHAVASQLRRLFWTVPQTGVRGCCMALLRNSIAPQGASFRVATRRHVIASDANPRLRDSTEFPSRNATACVSAPGRRPALNIGPLQ